LAAGGGFNDQFFGLVGFWFCFCFLRSFTLLHIDGVFFFSLSFCPDDLEVSAWVGMDGCIVGGWGKGVGGMRYAALVQMVRFFFFLFGNTSSALLPAYLAGGLLVFFSSSAC
jgi:hypothetical protein